MRAEPSFERVPLLRAVSSSDAPALRRANPGDYQEAAPDEQKQARGGFLRLVVFLVVMCGLGVTLAIAWRVIGSQSGARLWPALASQAGPSAAGSDPAGQLDRVAKELEALKATVGELSAVQRQMSATLTALQAAEEKLRSTQDDLQQRPTVPPAPSGLAAVSNALRLNTPQPPAPAVTPPRAAQAPRPAPPPVPPAAPQAAPAPFTSGPPLIRP